MRATAHWAFLIARIYEAFPLARPKCGNAMGLIAFVTEPASVARILEHLKLPPHTTAVFQPNKPAWGGPDTVVNAGRRLKRLCARGG